MDGNGSGMHLREARDEAIVLLPVCVAEELKRDVPGLGRRPAQVGTAGPEAGHHLREFGQNFRRERDADEQTHTGIVYGGVVRSELLGFGSSGRQTCATRYGSFPQADFLLPITGHDAGRRIETELSRPRESTSGTVFAIVLRLRAKRGLPAHGTVHGPNSSAMISDK